MLRVMVGSIGDSEGVVDTGGSVGGACRHRPGPGAVVTVVENVRYICAYQQQIGSASASASSEEL